LRRLRAIAAPMMPVPSTDTDVLPFAILESSLKIARLQGTTILLYPSEGPATR
jgi:hypothetical protein